MTISASYLADSDRVARITKALDAGKPVRHLVGPSMLSAAEYVSRNPACRLLDAQRYVGPHGSKSYGWQIVARAMRAGLIRTDQQGYGAQHALFVTELGERVIAEHR